MITFVDLAPVPTANLYLTIPVALAAGGWTWGELPRMRGVLAREYIYTAAECAAVVNAYGTALSRMIRTSEADRFCITVRGQVTGMLLRRAEWAWDDHLHEFAPDGEPLDGWSAAARAYWEATGQLISSQHFEASGGLPVITNTIRRDWPPMAHAA